MGLLHSCASDLAEAVHEFLCEPEMWLADKERSAVIREVTDHFAKTDGEWNNLWKAELQSLMVKV